MLSALYPAQMAYYLIQNKQLKRVLTLPASYHPLAGSSHLLPPLITALHRGFQAWGEAGYTPGPVVAQRIWFDEEGGLAVASRTPPSGLNQVGLAPDLAAWLVLLDKWMETFVVVARARSVWDRDTLAAALPFVTPAFLPPALVAQPPDNWTRVAQALAAAVFDQPLRGVSQDRHWRVVDETSQATNRPR